MMKTRYMLKTAVCLLLVAATVLSLCSCKPNVLNTEATELSSGYVRKTSAKGELTDSFTIAMAEFSLELFKGLVTNDEENDLFSPLSAAVCLAMIANGTGGETRAQMEAAFGMDIDTLNESLFAYTSSLYTDGDCKLNLANSIWFRDEQNRLHVKEEFLQTNADWYDAQIYKAPFDKSTLDDINEWCRHYTGGMIEKMIDEIDRDTVMYLINALAFDAKWAVKYADSEVVEHPFTNYGGTEATVKMLCSEEELYLAGDGVKGFAKNYSGDGYCIVALLPDEDRDIYEYIASLDGAAWLSLWNSRSSAAVTVMMPEFTYSVKMKLNDTLRAMGITDMFNSDAADFSKLGYSERGNLYCSDVDQKVFIQVDRSGTKAAAVTWGTVKDEAYIETNRVILDRPFVYAIVDISTGLPIFIGAVTNLG